MSQSGLKDSLNKMEGFEIKEIRKKFKLTQAQLGKRIGISDRQIRRLENSEQGIRPSIEILIKNLNKLPKLIIL